MLLLSNAQSTLPLHQRHTVNPSAHTPTVWGVSPEEVDSITVDAAPSASLDERVGRKTRERVCVCVGVGVGVCVTKRVWLVLV
jgi:hypothetical protein